MGHAVRKIGAPPQAVDAMFRQAGVIQVDTLDEMFDVAQLLAHQPLPRGRRVAIVGNSDALGLLAADAAAAVGLVVSRSVALGADATGPDFEDALDAAIDDPEVDSVVAVYIPPIDVSGVERRRRAGGRGGAVRQAAGLVVPRRRGRPRAAPRARRGRLDGRARLGAVVPRGRGGRAGARPRRRVRRVVAHPERLDRRARRHRRGWRRRLWCTGCSSTSPTAPSSRRTTSSPCWAAYGVRLWDARPVASLAAAAKARPRPRLGRRPQGHHRTPARAAGPRPRTAQHRPSGRDEGRLGLAERADRRRRLGRLRRPEERAARACP